MKRCGFCGLTDAYPFLRKAIEGRDVNGRSFCKPECASMWSMRDAVEPMPSVVEVHEVDGVRTVNQAEWATEHRRR